MPAKEEIRGIYGKRASNYDFTVQLYHLLGFRMGFYRQRAIESLHLKAGDTVVDIVCGTGANFSLLEENQWRNVELVRSDAAAYQFPDKVDGVISTFAIIYVPSQAIGAEANVDDQNALVAKLSSFSKLYPTHSKSTTSEMLQGT